MPQGGSLYIISTGTCTLAVTARMEVRIVFLPESISELTNEIFQQCLNRLDSTSQARVRRFYHREDAWRSLVGMLLPYQALREYGFPTDNVQFSRTSSGKPYLTVPTGMDFNVSHDKQMIAMISSVETSGQNASYIGIDVMRRKIPQGETVRTFIRAIDSTLSKTELDILAAQQDSHETEKYIFLLWTLKEAYSKALGLGLGFDFQRIEYHIPNNTVHIDGKAAEGWHFKMFEVLSPSSSDVYQGCIAYFKEDDSTSSLIFVDDPARDPLFHFVPLTEITRVE